MAKGKKRTSYKDTSGAVFKAAEKTGKFIEAESKGRPKGELDYYDCPFSTDVELEDFSKEFLIKQMRIWQMWYRSMALCWWAKVGEKFGKEAANELLPEVWDGLGQGMPMYLPLLGPNYKSAEDIKTVREGMKMANLPIDGGVDKTLFEGAVKWENDNLCTVTMAHCAMMEYFEALGEMKTVEWLCQVACPRGTEAYVVNPNIKVTGIKVPPRKKSDDPKDPWCIWEYRMMDKPQPRGKGRRREVGQNR